MKVAIVAESIYTFMSGAAVFTKRLIEQLNLRPDIEEVIVITAGRKKNVSIKGKIKIYSFNSLELKMFKKFPIALFKLKEIEEILKKEKVDIVHIQLPSPLCIAVAYYAKKLSVPIIVTSHTQPDNILENLNIKFTRAKKLFYKYITRVYKSADYIICGSEHGKKEMLSYDKDLKVPIDVISSIVDTKKFTPKGKKEKKILFVGRLMKEKRISTLIQASKIVIAKYPEYEFIIAGDGYLKEELKNLANDLNPKIRFTGYISDDELVKLYQSSEIFVLPSESELLGLVLLEAMSCGMVTIASDSKNSAAGEVANYKFRHNDHNDLASKIIHLIQNPNLVKKLSKENRKEVLKNHDSKNVLESYIRAYKKTIQIHKSKRVGKKLKKISLPFIYGFFTSKYMNNNYPLWIDFRATSNCNLHCIYCDISNRGVKDMSYKEIKNVIDKITTKSWILMTGGEPLVRKDIGKIIDYIVFNTPHYVILNTNLLLLKEKYDEVKNCNGFYFSLDGAKETHEKNKGKGTWNKIIEALELLDKEKRGKISMTVITSNTTIDDIKTVLSLSQKYHILPAFQMVRHYDNSGKSKSFSPDKEKVMKILDYIIEQRRKGFIMMNSIKGLIAQKKIVEKSLNIPCYSGRLFIMIDSDGVVSLCFSRSRNQKYLNLKNPEVTFKKALDSLREVKPNTVRCPDCSCMAPIEFALADLFNLDVIHHNNQSFSRFMKLENDFVKNH